MTDSANAPLPDMKKTMDADLVVNDDGWVCVFHEKPLPETFSWAEYHVADGHLYFVGETGRLQNMGITVPGPIQIRMEKAATVFLVHATKQGNGPALEIPLVVNKS